MKKTLMKLLFFALAISSAFAIGFSASALSTENCVGEGVDVSSYSELKDALENFTSGANIVLQGDISLKDDSQDSGIKVGGYGAVTVNLNGHNISVTSNKTKYLFDITGQVRLYFVSGKNGRNSITFNTTMPGAAAVRINHAFAEVTDVNVDFNMGLADGYKKTEDGSESYVYRVEKGSEMNFYNGVIYNGMEEGCGVYIAANENNKQKLNFRIGGYTKFQTDKYCVSFDPAAVRYVKFGSLRFSSINADKYRYVRIKVPSSSAATVRSLWYTSESGTSTTITVGGKLNLNQNKKITELGKGDIVAEKMCESINNSEYYMLLNCASGHVQLCGTCLMAYNGMEDHNSIKETGYAASCISDGATYGERCLSCNYTTSKRIPKKGHVLKYTPGVEENCGTNGVKEHFYCEICKCYFADSDGKTPLDKNTIVTENNHQVTYLPPYPATCTKTGVTEGIECLTCGKMVKEQTIVPAKGHTEEPITTYKEATCSREGRTAGAKCSVCQFVVEESKVIPKKPHSTKIVDGYPASCTQEGLSFGEYCEVCGYIVRPQEKIPPKGHIGKILKGKEATCKEDGLTDGIVCENCDLVLKSQEKIEKGPHKAQITEGRKATCKEPGLTEGSICSVCSVVLKAQVVIPVSKEHTTTIVRGTPATCEKEGLTDGIKCSVCEKVIEPQSVIPKLPHTEKLLKGEDATCEKEGKTDGIICGVCEKVIEKQETIPSNGHTVVSSVIRADLKNDGEIKESCAVCKKELGTKIISRVKTVKLSTSTYTYNGKKKTPSVTVKTATGETLKKGTDYDLSYSSGRKKVGNYSVKVIFKGNYSGEKTLTFKIKPGRTEKITVTRSESSVKLSWEKVSGATGYRVYLYNEKTKKYKTLGTTEKLSCTVKKLKSGTTYKFSVKAYTKTSKGTVWAEETHRITTATKPVVPTVTAKAGEGKAVLNWKTVTGATGYVVYMSEKKDGSYKKLGTTGKLSCTVKNLKKGKNYYFKVKAYKTVDGKNVYGDSCKYLKVKIK